jgi:hypothetical protein
MLEPEAELDYDIRLQESATSHHHTPPPLQPRKSLEP